MSFQPLVPLGGYIVLALLLFGVVAYFVVKEFRTPGHDSANRWDWSRRLGITALIIFMGFGPGTFVETTESARANVDVYFVVDRTGSMAAEDFDGSRPRLDGVRKDIMDITTLLPGARFGVVSFDSGATKQLPLTTDTNALRIWTTNLTQEVSLYSQGSSLNRVYNELLATLQDSREKYPQNQQVVVFMTDAENTTEDEERKSFADLAQFINAGAVLVYGTTEGGPMLQYDPFDDTPIYIPDHSQPGAPNAISVADVDEGKALASELGVEFAHRTGPTDLTPVFSSIDPEIVDVEGGRVVEVFQLKLWPFASGLAVLLIWELAATVARAARRVG